MLSYFIGSHSYVNLIKSFVDDEKMMNKNSIHVNTYIHATFSSKKKGLATFYIKHLFFNRMNNIDIYGHYYKISEPLLKEDGNI